MGSSKGRRLTSFAAGVPFGRLAAVFPGFVFSAPDLRFLVLMPMRPSLQSMLQAARRKGMPLFAAAAVFAAEPVEVLYAPADGETFVAASTVTRTTAIGGKEAKTDVSRKKSRVAVHRTEEGFENAVTVLSSRFEHEGHPIASPLFAAMEDLELTYRLDADGRLLGVTGYEKLADALKAKFPPAVSQAMAPLLDYRSVRLRDEAQYRQRHEEFLGRRFTPGAVQASAKAYALPYGGTIPLYVVTETRRQDGGRLELRQTFGSDAEKLAAAHAAVDADDLRAAAKNIEAAPPKRYAAASVEGAGETVLEPDTLFIVSRNSSADIELEILQPPKEPLKVSMREVRKYTSERETAPGP